MTDTVPPLLAELIADGERVAAYGQRTGRLRDLELISAVSAVHQLATPAWGNKEVLALQTAINRATQDISPVTISDLRDPTWRPFDPPPPWYKRPTQSVFVVFSLLLLALTSCATLNYNRGTALIAEMTAIAKDNPPATIVAATRVVVAGGAQDDKYNSSLDKLREFSQSMNLYDARSQKYIYESKGPYEAIINVITGGSRITAITVPNDRLSSIEYKSYDPCASLVDKAGVIVASVNQQQLEEATLCRNKIPPVAVLYSAYASFAGSDIRDWLDLWGLVCLPGLYGAFGATVFYMRRVIDPTIRNPSFTRFGLRVAMGAFAGVIITWFWAPNNQLLSSFSSAGLTLFTVAFLTGFGVEVLFVLLDRLVNGAMAIARGGDARTTLIAPVYLSSYPPSDARVQRPPETPKEDSSPPPEPDTSPPAAPTTL